VPRVVFGELFDRDLARQLAYLVAAGESARIDGIASDIDELAALFAVFPLAGRELAAAETGGTLRKLRLHRTPFSVWYSFDPAGDDAPVVMHRLFHVRQRTERPRLRSVC
jgi:plasmid stabilization system protein ParE